jgi:hypothetical protein
MSAKLRGCIEMHLRMATVAMQSRSSDESVSFLLSVFLRDTFFPPHLNR